MVRAMVPKERFMIMDIKDGWAPLCEFLGKPIPDEPFPRVNDADAVDKLGVSIMKKTALVWLGILSATGAVGFAGWWLWHDWAAQRAS